MSKTIYILNELINFGDTVSSRAILAFNSLAQAKAEIKNNYFTVVSDLADLGYNPDCVEVEIHDDKVLFIGKDESAGEGLLATLTLQKVELENKQVFNL